MKTGERRRLAAMFMDSGANSHEIAEALGINESHARTLMTDVRTLRARVGDEDEFERRIAETEGPVRTHRLTDEERALLQAGGTLTTDWPPRVIPPKEEDIVSKRTPPVTRWEIERLVRLGVGPTDIARKTGASAPTVYAIAREIAFQRYDGRLKRWVARDEERKPRTAHPDETKRTVLELADLAESIARRVLIGEEDDAV